MMDEELRYAHTAVFYTNGEALEIVKLPIPALKSGELLIRNACTTLCRSDISTYIGKRKEKTPTILGHEIVGRIESFGPNTPRQDQRGQELKEGDLVTWAIFASNPQTELAERGIPQKAEGLFKYGHEQLTETNTLHGGLSEYTILHIHTPLAKLKEDVPVKIAAIINCAVATVAGAYRLLGDVQNRNILISGVGMLGIIACAMAKAAGAKTIVAVDVEDERLKTAKRFGADICLRGDTSYATELNALMGKSNPIDGLIELSGVGAVMEYTLNLLGIGGTAVWVGAVFPQPALQLDAEKIIRNLHVIKGLHNYNTEDFVAAVVFMEQYYAQFPFTELVYDGFDLAHVNEAFEYALKQNPYRVGIRF
ncbi:zinc-binding dehydrogenase [Runella sp.]|jgi:putative phosphonate catabolism associated alcohol dehydrogenase|uniref:zinc-binding dehydrogenase n=1 Tax=Runella sp. TaxID=1960881 RepID=UPI002622F73B|nr:zinc-binding dehydrogenase [Runella sp.]